MQQKTFGFYHKKKTLTLVFVFVETQQGIFDAVLKGYIDFDSDPWPLISDSAKDLIRKMLCSRPSDHLTAHEALCIFSYSCVSHYCVFC